MRSLPAALPLAALALLLLGATEDAVPEPSDGRSGRDIYSCVLDNRFSAYVQEAKLVSGDRGEASQESRLRMTWKSFRDEQDEPRAGVLSKTLVRYEHPFDLRFSGYLVINNVDRPNDQFVYLAATRKIRRVNLRKEAVFGTDFTFEDIVPAEIEDADYRRLSDVVVDGRSVYVVEVVPKPHADSEYSRFVVYVPRENCVPVRTRYWDDKGVEVKNSEGVYNLLVSYRSGDMWAPKVEQTEALKLEAQYFIECCGNGAKPINDGAAGLEVVRMLEGSIRSLQNRGGMIEL